VALSCLICAASVLTGRAFVAALGLRLGDALALASQRDLALPGATPARIVSKSLLEGSRVSNRSPPMLGITRLMPRWVRSASRPGELSFPGQCREQIGETRRLCVVWPSGHLCGALA
jgi:hypothetical protein